MTVATTILILDDSLTVRMDLAEALVVTGFAVVPCNTVAEARAALRSQTIDLAILDVRLPDGDGLDFLVELRAMPRLAELPVLMLSTESEIRDRIRGMKHGANDYIGKPYDLGFVIGRIRQLVGATASTRTVVLLIDDSVTYRTEIARAFTAAGYIALTASNGTEGLRIAAQDRPSAIVVDGEMPDMDGTTVIRRIRLDPALRTIPCLLLTGSDSLDVELRALDAGADSFVRKTVEPNVVIARLAAILRTAEPVAEKATSLAESRRILVVDAHANGLADSLRDHGFDVVTASSGEDAIELLAVQPVDCVLLDQGVKGLPAVEVCRRIKGAPSLRNTPVLVRTDNANEQVAIEILGAGADDLIGKDIAFDLLRARVEAQIRRKHMYDEHRGRREQITAREHAETRAAIAGQLERANAELSAANVELEAFSYSISHDLRAPLRSISSFAMALVEDQLDRLDESGRDQLRRILLATSRMGEMIDALLELSKVTRSPLTRRTIDITAIVATVIDELQHRHPDRRVTVEIEPGMIAIADPRLARIVFDNLLGNAWKFTSQTAAAKITVAADQGVFSVGDNGAGFDMAFADKLFAPFSRLHTQSEFSGTGIGLATVRRIVERHGGRIRGEGQIGHGARFSFTLP